MEEENQLERYAPAALARRRPAAVRPSDTIEMEEAADLRAYGRLLRKRRWTVLTLFFVLFTLVLIGTLKQRPLYRAAALLEIQTENPQLVSLEQLFAVDSISDSYLETQYKVLRSDTLARRVIEQLRLDTLAEFNPPPRWWSAGRKQEEPLATQTFAVPGAAGETPPAASQRVLEQFRERLAIEPVKRSRLVTVAFESQDPARAARVVNALAAAYIEQTLESRWEATQKASEWLSRELVTLKAKLERSEEELQRYAHQQGLLFLESAQGSAENIVNQRLRQLQEELTRAQATRFEKESLYRLLEAGEEASLPGVLDSKLMQDLTVRLAELKREQAQLAATFAADYPRMKQVQSQRAELEAVLSQERARAAKRIRNEYEAARRREALLAEAFARQQQQANLIAERSVQYNILKREVETNQQLYEGLLGRLKEAGVSAGLKASNIRIVDAATPPERPLKPRLLLNLALALVLGLGLGVGAAFLQEHLDNTLKTAEDVERFLRLPALALIPAVESLNGRRLYGFSPARRRGKFLLGTSQPAPPLAGPAAEQTPTPAVQPQAHWYRIDADDGQSSRALGEAFRSLRTSVLLSTAERPPRSLLVSSSRPGEGKTTIATNLALSLAQLGQRVLLIDGDMRRPCLHKVFARPAPGEPDGGGLASYLTGQGDWPALVEPAGVPGLDLLVCGPLPPNPAELLSSDRMRLLLRQALADYAVVVLDSPPLLNVADSRILASLVEGLVLVVQGGATPRELVLRARTTAREVGAHVIGVVLNNLNLQADDYYFYRYYHYDYYGQREESLESRGT